MEQALTIVYSPLDLDEDRGALRLCCQLLHWGHKHMGQHP